MQHLTQEGQSRRTHRPNAPAIGFAWLSDVSPDLLVAHMSDPRMVEHMPLLTEPWDIAVAKRFVTAKGATWRRDELGHWAVLADGSYVGWGGFQKEGDEWDFGLVLRPDAFGLGAAWTAKPARRRPIRAVPTTGGGSYGSG